MDVRSIIAEIDAEIAKLQGVKATLTGLSTTAAVVSAPAKSGRRGRPKGSKNAAKAATVVKATKVAKPAKAKRKLSPEGRKRIADAMKRRWAERRKEAAK
jgi:hypothetical protein